MKNIFTPANSAIMALAIIAAYITACPLTNLQNCVGGVVITLVVSVAYVEHMGVKVLTSVFNGVALAMHQSTEYVESLEEKNQQHHTIEDPRLFGKDECPVTAGVQLSDDSAIA